MTEAQVGGPRLADLLAPTHAIEGQGRIGPGDEHQLHVLGQVLGQPADHDMHVGQMNEVVVVEHQDQGAGQGCKAEQRGVGQPDRGQECRRSQQLLHFGHGVRVCSAHRGDEVQQEGREVVVMFVQRKPGVRAVDRVQPLTDKGGLAVASRRGDENQPPVFVTAKLIQQARTSDQQQRGRRPAELGRQHRHGCLHLGRTFHGGHGAPRTRGGRDSRFLIPLYHVTSTPL